MSYKPPTSPLKLYTPLPRYMKKRWNWKLVAIIVITVIITAALVRFFDNISYNRQINQAVNQEKVFESQEGKDLTRLFQSFPGQLDCSKFLTNFAQQQCQEHNKS